MWQHEHGMNGIHGHLAKVGHTSVCNFGNHRCRVKNLDSEGTRTKMPRRISYIVDERSSSKACVNTCYVEIAGSHRIFVTRRGATLRHRHHNTVNTFDRHSQPVAYVWLIPFRERKRRGQEWRSQPLPGQPQTCHKIHRSLVNSIHGNISD